MGIMRTNGYVWVLGFALLFLLSLFAPSFGAHVSILDVGQGDAVLLQDGTIQVLVDAGEGDIVLERLAEEMPWFDRTIEVVVLTHPHRDHIEGFFHVLDRYDVGMVLLPYASYRSQMYGELLERIVEKGIPYRIGWAGQRISAGSFDMRIIAPFDSEEAASLAFQNVNEASIGMRVDIHDMSFLLTGDIEAGVERMIVQRVPPDVLNVDVLKVGHHGSRTSTTSDFLERVIPSAAVISSGEGNRYGHPHSEVLGRLEGVYVWRTDQGGTVRFVWDGSVWGHTQGY